MILHRWICEVWCRQGEERGGEGRGGGVPSMLQQPRGIGHDRTATLMDGCGIGDTTPVRMLLNGGSFAQTGESEWQEEGGAKAPEQGCG